MEVPGSVFHMMNTLKENLLPIIFLFRKNSKNPVENISREAICTKCFISLFGWLFSDFDLMLLRFSLKISLESLCIFFVPCPDVIQSGPSHTNLPCFCSMGSCKQRCYLLLWELEGTSTNPSILQGEKFYRKLKALASWDRWGTWS